MAYTGTDLNHATRGWVKERSAVNVLDYGAVGDGVTDDTEAIQNAIDSCESVLDLNGGTYLVDHLTFAEDNILILGNGATLIQSDASSTDFVIINGDNNTFRDLKISRSQTNASNLDGFVINGDSFKGINLKTDGFTYAIDVYGDNALLFGCEGVTPNYAGCRLFANSTKLNRFSLLSYKITNSPIKGFVYNGTGGVKDLIIRDFLFVPPADELISDGQNAILLDSGSGNYDIDNFYCENVDITCGGSGSMKLENCEKAFIRNATLVDSYTYSSGYGIYSAVSELHLDNIKTNRRITVEKDVYINNLEFLSAATATAHCIYLVSDGAECQIRNSDFSESNLTTNIIRVDRATATTHHILVENTKCNSSYPLFGMYKDPANLASALELGSNVTNYSAIANASVYSKYIYSKNIYGTRTYRSSNIPSTGASSGAFVVGDICYHTTPTAGNYIGWVCVTAGTPGTWKTFGVIEN